MGRRRGGGGGRRRSYSSSPPPPMRPKSSSPPAQPTQGGGLFSGLAGTMMQGAALGTGSAFAHRAVDSMMGGREHPGPESSTQAPPQETDVCQNQSKAFADCITANNGDMAACQYYFDMLQQCKVSGGQF